MIVACLFLASGLATIAAEPGAPSSGPAATPAPKAAPAAPSEAKIPVRFDLGAHGKLELSLPPGWVAKSSPNPKSPYPTIGIRPTDSQALVLVITPLWSPTHDASFNDQEHIRKLIDGDRNGMAPRSVEPTLELVELHGPSVRGFYFKATDKAPKAGDYEHVIRAGLGIGDLLLSATILSHEKDSEGVRAALEVLRDVRQVAAKVVPATAPAR